MLLEYSIRLSIENILFVSGLVLGILFTAIPWE